MVLPFNYIVTIHNAEAVLPGVLQGIEECAGAGARIILVLDGCRDGSEVIATRFARKSRRETVLVYAPDVHEIKSLNLGLQKAQPGYCVLVQDDVILQEPRLEALVHQLCESFERRLGYISFRLAAEIRSTPFLTRARYSIRAGRWALRPMIEEDHLLAGRSDQSGFARVDHYQFYPRMVGIKSPVCLTPELRACEPYLDEQFAPYCYDDVDLSLRALRAGLLNGLYSIPFRSDPAWSGTLRDSAFVSSFGAGIRLRNRQRIWCKHRDLLMGLWGDPSFQTSLIGERS
jgi:glycosyltransferase involved in cell wall biosynthesis